MSKSGYSGDMLIGYEGVCLKCGSAKRLYYARCNEQIQRLMLRRLRGYYGTCEVCYIERGGLKNTVTKWHELSRLKVDKDLATLESGMAIDFGSVDSNIRSDLQSEAWLAENEWKVNEYKKAAKKGKTCTRVIK